MEAEQVRSRVAIAVGLKLGVDHDKARVVGDAVLRVIQECGLITVVAADLAKVNYLMAVGIAQNAALHECVSACAARFLEYEASHRAKGTPEADEKADRNAEMVRMCEAALADPDDIVIEGASKPVADA